jgi:S1-C subfamily serine protease
VLTVDEDDQGGRPTVLLSRRPTPPHRTPRDDEQGRWNRIAGALAPSVLLAAVVLLAGCSPADDEPADDAAIDEPTDDDAADADAPTDAPDADDQLTEADERIPDLVRDIAPSTVSIEIVAAEAGQVLEAGGSGVIWDPDGIVITNDHVVAPADEIHVILGDGTRYEAELIAGDPRTDLAALQIDATDLPAAPFTERLPDIGEMAVAIGNPLGFQNTATAGIVSGVDRSLPIVPDAPPLVGLIQTDAAISSGNSGGALVGRTGEVIGINVAAVDDAHVPGVAQGLGFAIPSSTVIPVVEQLLEDGEVAHAYLGIRGANLTPQVADQFGIERDTGVLIGEVEPDSPADEAGLEQGQVIIEVEDATIDDMGDLLGVLQRLAPGDQVAVTIDDAGEQATAEVTLDERPDEEPL